MSGHDVQVDEVTTLAELEALRAPWQELFHRCLHATPFQSPAWILAWCRQLRCERIWTLVVRQRERLLAVAPWLIYPRDNLRVVAFLAGGVSDYHDVLVDSAHFEVALSALFHRLARRAELWDLCDFEALAPHAAWRTIALPSAWTERETRLEECPRLVLGSSSLADVVPTHQLARYRKYRRRLERGARVELHIARASDWPAALAELVRLHTARWNARGELGMLSTDLLAFHGDVAGQLAQEGSLRLYGLRAAGATVAALYGFVLRRTLYCYLQGLDPEHADASPGTILLGMVLESALGEGIEVVDFLRGGEAYKHAWGARGPHNVRRQIARVGSLPSLAAAEDAP